MEKQSLLIHLRGTAIKELVIVEEQIDMIVYWRFITANIILLPKQLITTELHTQCHRIRLCHP